MYHFGNTVIRSLLNGPVLSVSRVVAVFSASTWIHAYLHIPRERLSHKRTFNQPCFWSKYATFFPRSKYAVDPTLT